MTDNTGSDLGRRDFLYAIAGLAGLVLPMAAKSTSTPHRKTATSSDDNGNDGGNIDSFVVRYAPGKESAGPDLDEISKYIRNPDYAEVEFRKIVWKAPENISNLVGKETKGQLSEYHKLALEIENIYAESKKKTGQGEINYERAIKRESLGWNLLNLVDDCIDKYNKSAKNSEERKRYANIAAYVMLGLCASNNRVTQMTERNYDHNEMADSEFEKVRPIISVS